ncbi:hypothetical protein KZX68_12880 [Microbacterium sp. EYE_80]|nr:MULTISPECIES: hypothetical protein [unclassified Microbacterium]MCK6080597.1 hypothetical protein [Microbacterium sp. EYE_382]MCK6124634.1 hypothetical protein [Microbacterium sp. EYE_80]MCK6228053.1 hypothetical protein [Microbacterium sp. EYE_77]MCK6248049.1 hypothetical protein [Microbacterium sp. EYE_78]
MDSARGAQPPVRIVYTDAIAPESFLRSRGHLDPVLFVSSTHASAD